MAGVQPGGAVGEGVWLKSAAYLCLSDCLVVVVVSGSQ